MNTYTNEYVEMMSLSQVVPGTAILESFERWTIRQMVEYCHLCLKCSLPAQEVALQAGITDKAAITEFSLGYVNQVQRTGLFESKRHAFYGWVLVIPLYDIDGNVVGIYEYRIDPAPIYERTRLILLDSYNTGIFNPNVISKEKQITICSDPIQACQLWCQGYRNIVSIMSDTEITYAQVQRLLKNSPVMKAVFIESEDLMAQHQLYQLMLYLKSMGVECISQEG